MRLKRIDVKRDHLGELGGLIRRDIAGCRGGYDGGGGRDRIGGLGKGRQLAKQRLVSSRGHESIHAQSKRPDIAGDGHCDELLDEFLRPLLQHFLHSQGSLVSRSS